jgi:hypothetical protein
VVAAQVRLRLAKRRAGLRRDLHRDAVAAGLGVRRVGGAVAGLVTGGHLFDLAARLAGGGLDPGLLGRRRRDARELADRREMEGAAGERGLETGEHLERRRDAQALLGLARGEPAKRSAYSKKLPSPNAFQQSARSARRSAPHNACSCLARARARPTVTTSSCARRHSIEFMIELTTSKHHFNQDVHCNIHYGNPAWGPRIDHCRRRVGWGEGRAPGASAHSAGVGSRARASARATAFPFKAPDPGAPRPP